MSSAIATKRPYRMQARADAALATRERIVDAAVEVFWERPTDQISLDEVGRRAGVTKQTVLRHFGTKAELLAAGAPPALEEGGGARGALAPGGGPRAGGAAVAHSQ